ncbi:hypothetical protein [Arthrobacter sp. NEB 688]|uniref:hypothetical protein n=1 Tax=Arthrobacter sp. NEB 688 TaxID=904039 RepID=UPI00156407FF|nr:hypothetical protein [Arthrobacter sp. NEB 688]QKE85402.1 hypothetical protein HL663_16655 [Arthrobacter sp. NEB 688]
MTRRSLALLAGAALVATVLGGCTDDPPPTDPSPSASGSASGGPSASASATPQDRSAAVVGGAAPLTEIATTKARASSSFEGATFGFYRLTRSDSSTLLVWRVTGGDGASSPRDANIRFWEKYPVMVAGGKKYSVVTFDKQDDGWSALSDPALRLSQGLESPPISALYPPLPAGTTEVTLTSPWFADVKVPVTDAATTG